MRKLNVMFFIALSQLVWGQAQTIPFDESLYIVKDVKYDYDLISGKVNQVTYQGGESDQLQHRYEYDGDNRITAVYTSTDGITWTKEAQYEYYAHGPLTKAELGEQKVETQNYAYTLQGWIKGVKGQNFSYALGYNDTDYKAIVNSSQSTVLSTPIAQHTVNGQLTTDNLYNGNISTWATNTPALSVKGVADMTNQYTYDQLNRIKGSTVFGKADAYKTGYSYDANGNILTLQRFNGTGQLFDQFSYNYENKVAGYLQNTNKLRSVDDAISNTALHEEDLEDQNTDNYQYDDIGNLNKDVQEDIDKIEWTVYGKVKAVYRKSGSLKPNLIFEYDASGNRVSKISIANGGTVSKTFYIRDASGNVMSTYTSTGTSSLIALQEQYLYGSSRLGVLEKGGRSYELTDHLGDVRTVVSEFKEVKAAYDYYAFGMSLAKLDNGYRYGFNGKERDTEDLGGGGNSYDYGMRIYNTQIGRFLSVDPIADEYPELTPYQFASNIPISGVDQDGFEYKLVIHYTAKDDQGNTKIKKTRVDIHQNFVHEEGGKKYAKTEVVYIDEDGNVEFADDEALLEEIGEGKPKPSASYDYTKSSAQKIKEDAHYIIHGKKGSSTLRHGDILVRDENAPDNNVSLDQTLDDIQNRASGSGYGKVKTSTGVKKNAPRKNASTKKSPKSQQSKKKAEKKNEKKTSKKERSKHPIGKRLKFPSMKKAYEAAKNAGKGEPVKHSDGEHGPHYHPGDGKGKPLNHDHYYFPK